MPLKIGKGTLAGIYNKLLQGGMAAALTSSFMAPLAQAHEIHSKLSPASSVSAVEVKSNGEISVMDDKYGNYVVHQAKSFSQNMMDIRVMEVGQHQNVNNNFMDDARVDFDYRLFFKRSDRKNNMIVGVFDRMEHFIDSTPLDIKIEDVLPEGLRGKNIKSGDDYYNYIMHKYDLSESQLNEIMNGFVYHHEMAHLFMDKELLENENNSLPDELKDDQAFFKQYVAGKVDLAKVDRDELLKKNFFVDSGTNEAFADFNAYITMRDFMKNKDEYKDKDVDGILRDTFLVPRAINVKFHMVNEERANELLEEGDFSKNNKYDLMMESLSSHQEISKDGHNITIPVGVAIFENPEKFENINANDPRAVFNAFVENFGDKFGGENPYSSTSPDHKDSVVNGVNDTFDAFNESEGIHKVNDALSNRDDVYDFLNDY